MLKPTALACLICVSVCLAQAQQQTMLASDPTDPFPEPVDWQAKYGKQVDSGYSGPLSFSHLPYSRCLDDKTAQYDVAVIGMPFDTGVSYRPGARFGPYAIRSGSRRQGFGRGYTLSWKMNPYAVSNATFMDCGDIPVVPYDNILAMDQLEVAYTTLLTRPVARINDVPLPNTAALRKFAKDGKDHPRIVSLGGDHTIVLPILRALHKVYGPVAVIHFDAHTDTGGYKGNSNSTVITHGSYFYIAWEENLILDNNIHAGIRQKMNGAADMEHDKSVNFETISSYDIDDIGVSGVVKSIRERIGDSPVYLTLDIDVIDPGQAPATGTPEAGGWTTREVKRILQGLAGLNFVGFDLVEVAPAYDTADVTGIIAADLINDFFSMMMYVPA